MAQKKRGHRRGRRGLRRRFEQAFDLRRLDYPRRMRPVQGRAKLIGVVAAFVTYTLGFAVGYYGWQNGFVAYALFAKFVWVLMVPASVIGVFAWLLAKNRMEYPIREDIRACIQALEGGGGLLWRFAPVVDELAPDDRRCKEAMALSRAGRAGEMDPEDYSAAVRRLDELVRGAAGRPPSAGAAAEVGRNFEAASRD